MGVAGFAGGIMPKRLALLLDDPENRWTRAPFERLGS